MSENTPPTTRSFHCGSCGGQIQIPYDLPPTTAPCPHCGTAITSPPPPEVAGDAQSDPVVLTAAQEVPPITPPSPEPAPPPSYGVETAPPPPDVPEPVSVAPPEEVAPVPEVPSPAEASLPEPVPGDEAPLGDDLSAPDPIGASASGELSDSERPELIPNSAVPLDADAILDSEPARRRSGMHPAIPFLVAILLIVGVLVGFIVIKRQDGETDAPVVDTPPVKKRSAEERKHFLREGWKIDAANTLTTFLRSKNLEEKVKHVIGGGARFSELQAFYGGKEVDDSDTPIESFSDFDLSISDKERGLFLMRYERPAQYDMKEFFRPVAPLEVQHQTKEPDMLLSAFASRKQFAMEPVRVMAFFKQEGNRLLLDWDVYAQTKYRTLKHFNTYPQPGEKKVFRVIVQEDVPSVSGTDLTKYRFFRFTDPAHSVDYVKIPVAMESREGKILSDLAWIDLPGRDAQNRYATVELAWSQEDDPQVQLSRVLCWEFLGLGGVEGNAVPVEEMLDAGPALVEPEGEEGASGSGEPAPVHEEESSPEPDPISVEPNESAGLPLDELGDEPSLRNDAGFIDPNTFDSSVKGRKRISPAERAAARAAFGLK